MKGATRCQYRWTVIRYIGKRGLCYLETLTLVELIVFMFYYFSVFEKDPYLEEELIFNSAV